MARYIYDVNISKHNKYRRLFKRLIFLLLLLLVIVIGLIIYDAIKEQLNEQGDATAAETVVVKPKTITFTTDYFSFTAPDTWKFMDKESTKSTYVYRSYRGNLVEQELNVHINTSSTVDVSAIRVVPVNFNQATRMLEATVASEHCNTFTKQRAVYQPIRVSLLNTSMMCQLDGTNYLLVAGQIGGSDDMKFKSINGSNISVKVFYRYSAVPADNQYFIKLLNTFKIL